MSDAPETPDSSPLRQPSPAPRRIDPWAVVLVLGVVVLLGAAWWLFSTPRVTRAEVDAARIGRIESRFDALERMREQTAALTARVEQIAPLENRLRAVEERPGPPDIRPLESQIAALTERAATIERGATQVAERAIANERRLTAVEGRPVFDPATVPDRAAFDALSGRVERLAERADTLGNRIETMQAEQTGRFQEFARAQEERARAAEQAAAQRASALENQLGQRISTVESQLGQRISTAETQLGQRIEAVEGRLRQQVSAAQAELGQRVSNVESQLGQQVSTARTELGQRVEALEGQLGQRVSALETQLGQRMEAVESRLGDRLSVVERSQQRLAALEDRTARLAAIDGLQTALSTGEPLGLHLGRIEFPPPALTRFALTPPPTEASLRLSFEEAARAARAASDAAASPRPGGGASGVVDSALARLGGLVTVRRGEQVVWGDAAEAEIERARRALEAGDLEASLGFIAKLPYSAAAAMDGWAEQARALLAARAALRQLAATTG